MLRKSLIPIGIFLTFGLWTGPVFPDVHRSSDFGWTAGQDVTSQFSAKLTSGFFYPGDELILDHTYQISGSHQLPSDFTLSGDQGAGFDVTDMTSTSNHTFLQLGNRTALRNLTINYLNTPPLGPAGTNPTRGTDFYPATGIAASNKGDIVIENCRLVGSISTHVRLNNTPRPLISGTHMQGGYWTNYLSGNVTDAVYENCVIEQYQGDGIKTVRGGNGTQDALVDNCVFQDGGRDGIDTTGGWKNSTVRNTIFRRLFSGMDIKSGYEDIYDVLSGLSNTGILIEDSVFTDTGGVVLSTIDRGYYTSGQHLLNTTNCHELAPHDIDINNSVFEVTTHQNGRMLHLKGGHTVRYSNVEFLSAPGHAIEVARYTNVYDVFGPNTLSEEVSDVLNYGVTGSGITTGLAAMPGDTSVPFDFGPTIHTLLLGDVDGNAVVDAADISPFAQVLQGTLNDPLATAAADCDQNGINDAADIAVFVAILQNGGTQPEPGIAAPEPTAWVLLGAGGIGLLRRGRVARR